MYYISTSKTVLLIVRKNISHSKVKKNVEKKMLLVQHPKKFEKKFARKNCRKNVAETRKNYRKK